MRSEIAFASCSAESIVGLEDGSFAHQCGTTGMFSLAASKCCIAAGQNWPRDEPRNLPVLAGLPILAKSRQPSVGCNHMPQQLFLAQ